jgi:hypothetical protein
MDEQQKIVKAMLSAQRYDVRDLRNALTGLSDVEIALTIHGAREHVRREHGIIFGRVRGHSGVYERTNPKQTIGQAARQQARGRRALENAAEKLELVSETSPDEKERAFAARSAARVRERIAFSGAARKT